MFFIFGMIVCFGICYVGVKLSKSCESFLESLFTIVLTGVFAGSIAWLSIFWYIVTHMKGD